MRGMKESASPKLDHVVLPVADLDTAQTRLRALGFTVAPVGDHPFGTSNCCVYLADGTFLEPLAVRHQAAADEAIAARNVFVDRDRAYRAIAGDDGFSAVVLATNDARRDHDTFAAAGISAGPVLEFTRPFVDATGKADGATFRLAFGAEAVSPLSFFFTCQRVRSPRVNRAALQEHRNGVTRIASIGAEAAEPQDHRSFLVTLFGNRTSADPQSLSLDFDGRTIAVTRAGAPGLRLTSITFDCASLDSLLKLLDADGVVHTRTNGVIIVPPAPGQGATFIFESKP